MPALPSSAHLDELLAELDNHYAGRQQMAKRIKRLLERDHRGGDATPDGYPSSVGGGSSHSAKTSSVETAVIARERPRRDPVHAAAASAARALDDAVAALHRVHGALELADRTLLELGPPADVGCWAMAELGVFEPAHVMRAPIPGQAEPRPLGRWSYRFVRDNGRLPTLDERRRHAQGRRVYLPANVLEAAS